MNDFKGTLTYERREDGTYFFGFEGVLNDEAIRAIKIMIPVLEQTAEEEKGFYDENIERVLRGK